MSDLTDIFEFCVSDSQTDAFGKMTGNSLEGSVLKAVCRRFRNLCPDRMHFNVVLHVNVMPSLHDRFVVVLDDEDCDNSCVASIRDLDGYEYGRAVASWSLVG